MNKKKYKKNKLKELFLRSKVAALFLNISAFLRDKAEYSVAGRIMTSYDSSSADGGVIGTLKKDFPIERRVVRPVKRTISRLVSQSFLLNRINDLLKGFLYTKMNVYGLFLVAAGIGSFLVSLMKVYLLERGALSFADTFASALLFVCALPLVFSSSTLIESVGKSRFASYLIFDYLGAKRVPYEPEGKIVGHGKSALPAGLLFCLASWWIDPLTLTSYLIYFTLATAVFYTPETGIIILTLVLPFASAAWLKAITCFIIACFAMKYIRGKRTLKFDPLSLTALIFTLIVAVAGMKAESLAASRDYICRICVYFLVVNLIKSKKWLERCVKSASASFCAVAVYGAAKYAAGLIGSEYLSNFFGSNNIGFMTSCFGSETFLAEYLILAAPVAFVGFYLSNKNGRVALFTGLASGIVCLVLTYNRGAWISALLGVLFFMTLYGKKTLAFVLFGLSTVPFALFYIPPSVFERLSVSGGLADAAAVGVGRFASTFSASSFFNGSGWGTASVSANGDSYGAWRAMCAEVGILGFLVFCFMLFLCLQKNLTSYSNGCGRNGKLVSVAAMAGLFSLVVFGINYNIFADYRLCAAFWLVLGLSSTVGDAERNAIGSTIAPLE